MENISFNNIIIAENKPVIIIAEAACEHRGSMDAAKRLIDATKEVGADIIKFQLHIPSEEMIGSHPKMKFWAGSMEEVLKEVNFETATQHKELKKYCDKVGIQYLCTPFCAKAADILMEVGVDAFKIGSGELTNLPMLRHIAKLGKPMIVSTGMSTMDEISDTVTVLKEEKVPFMLTHCLSEYPARYENMNLCLIPELEKKFNVMVGFSDHSTEITGAIAAVALGAPLIEKHFTIRDLNGPDDVVSLDPTEFKKMVDAIRNTEKALGSRRQISDKEQETRSWAHHSVVTIMDIKKGDKITLDNTAAKRPGNGIPPKFLDPLYSKKLLGKKVSRDISVDTVLIWDDVA